MQADIAVYLCEDFTKIEECLIAKVLDALGDLDIGALLTDLVPLPDFDLKMGNLALDMGFDLDLGIGVRSPLELPPPTVLMHQVQ